MIDPFSRATITALIKTHYSGLINLVRGLVKSKDLAADILHQAIATTLEHIEAGRIASPDQFAGYVFKTCKNLLLNHRRKMGNRSDLRADPEHLTTLAADEQVDFSDEQRLKETVVLALRSLGSRDRDVVMRFYLYDEDKETICRDYGLSPTLFNKIISRARRRLKEQLAARGITGTDILRIVLLAFASVHCEPPTS